MSYCISTIPDSGDFRDVTDITLCLIHASSKKNSHIYEKATSVFDSQTSNHPKKKDIFTFKDKDLGVNEEGESSTDEPRNHYDDFLDDEMEDDTIVF
ncbi:hypothetical protein GOBAR_DD20671 [Gossypium barbadense]|nr:hypothetical protein GOBAR_DD20671 [Gossypium barbadense]